MKICLFIIALVVIDPSRIAKVNSAKTEAIKAYMDGDYKKAVSVYTYLTDTLDVREDEVMVNLANAYFQVKDTANAISTYQALTASPKSHIRSKAQQQLGILHHRQGKLEEALPAGHSARGARGLLSRQAAAMGHRPIMARVITLGSVVVHVEGSRTLTDFGDGHYCIGAHAEQDGQAETAASVGMSVEEMNRCHDLTHSLLAHWLGLRHSPTLYGVATGHIYQHHQIEETAVLAVQRWANVAGVDLANIGGAR